MHNILQKLAPAAGGVLPAPGPSNFGGCYACAIGFSLTVSIEIVYWIIVKPFGLKKKQCQYKTCTQHHYPSPTAKRITTLGQGTITTALLIFIGFRFYLVAHRYLNLPIPDENRNQIKPFALE